MQALERLSTCFRASSADYRGSADRGPAEGEVRIQVSSMERMPKEIFISGTEPRQYCDQHDGLNYAGDLQLQPRTFVWNSGSQRYEQIRRPVVRRGGSGGKGIWKKLKKLKFW